MERLDTAIARRMDELRHERDTKRAEAHIMLKLADRLDEEVSRLGIILDKHKPKPCAP